jgi:hypothetical protein
MQRWSFAALALLCALSAASVARAQSASSPANPPPAALPVPWTPASRLSLVVDARGEIGSGRVAGIDLGLVGAGLEWRATPTLRLQASALLLGATGSADNGWTANGGAGGELGARLVPFPRGSVGPYLRASGGLLLFLRGPFLPGGDGYDFILRLGAGLEVPLGPRLSLFGDLHAVHLSNGQGLGPFNPAFTGEGGSIGAAYALAPPGSLEAPEPIAAVDEARPGWRPGATFDAGAGSAAGALELALRDRVAQRLTRHTLALMDIESGTVASAHFVEAGIDFAGHWTFVSAGVHSGYRSAAGPGMFVEAAQIEAVASAEASLVLMGQADLSRAAPDTFLVAAVLRLFPVETFLIELGGGARQVGGAPFDDRFEPHFSPYLALDWQLPFAVRTWQASLFLERQLDALQIAGVRISWDMGATLRNLVRRTGWRRIR